MKEILERFSDCDKFSLTGSISKYNITISEDEYRDAYMKTRPADRQKFMDQFLEKYNITEEEFLKALEKIKNYEKLNLKRVYDSYGDKLKNYPKFEKLYEDIEKECYEFNSEENKQYYVNMFYNDERINEYKKLGFTDEEINKKKENCFKCSYIADNVGKTTKYGNEYKEFFWNFYFDVAHSIERKKDKDFVCISDGKNPIEQVPNELKKHLLYYEVSFSNDVTISGGLMINYYFNLNEDTKKYLLKFEDDFALKDLDDLTLYKGDELKFYSCTHEQFNSLDYEEK